MVARIGQGSSLRQSFYYNENKVREGVATLLLAHNYPRKAEDLTEKMRLGLLQKMAQLRPTCKVNSLHISLNFDASEKLLPEKLCAIAKDYMEQLGFGFQPFLVYEHRDAGHPHIHILTTNIEADGSRISLHNLARAKSEPARKSIEEHYGLVKAEDSTNAEKYRLEAVSAKAIYGRTETKRAIQNVLQSVLDSYRFTSLPELNAILRCYNVEVEMGREGTRMAVGKGLYFRVLDKNGQHSGTPIKASAFYMKPTLKRLEQQFEANQKYKRILMLRVRNKVQSAAFRAGNSLEDFQKGLRKSGIDLLFRRNEQGNIYGVTFIDHLHKTAFNGSELGKELSAKALLERFDGRFKKQQNEVETEHISVTGHNEEHTGIAVGLPQIVTSTLESVSDSLLSPEQLYEPIPLPFQIGKRRRRKKKKR